MAVKGNSFWSTTSGVVTGVAGTLTGVVGIATMATQMGWIGSGGDDQQAASQTTTSTGLPSTTDGTEAGVGEGRSATTDGRASRSGTATSEATATYTVDPPAVSFRPIGGRTATVTVRNTGTVEVDVRRVAVEGPGGQAFSVDAGGCTGTAVDPGRSCAITVAFAPEGSGATEATLVVEVEGAPAKEVALSGAALL